MVVRHERYEFGPLIIQWLKENYGDIIVQIQEFTTQQYFGYGMFLFSYTVHTSFL